MASPGDFEGQHRGACGHVMAAFDLHERCARCREKKIGEDPCVKGKSYVTISRIHKGKLFLLHHTGLGRTGKQVYLYPQRKLPSSPQWRICRLPMYR